VPLERSDGLGVGLALGASPLTVVAARAVQADLGFAAVWITLFSCRLPPRSSRWRMVSPDAAAIGAVPANDAYAAADRNRVGSPVMARMVEAPVRPIPTMSVRRLPCSLSIQAMSASSGAILRSTARSSATSSRTMSRRRIPTGSVSRTA